ncbi:hypothetical protein, partial [Mesorhizobium sp.]|uniref:hypothetical protein n=1 Tax=Mesorhizobium sp. TaxID=1871066 RepID=UPI00257A1B21
RNARQGNEGQRRPEAIALLDRIRPAPGAAKVDSDFRGHALRSRQSIGPKSGNRFWENPMLKQKARCERRHGST